MIRAWCGVFCAVASACARPTVADSTEPAATVIVEVQATAVASVEPLPSASATTALSVEPSASAAGTPEEIALRLQREADEEAMRAKLQQQLEEARRRSPTMPKSTGPKSTGRTACSPSDPLCSD